MWERGSGSGLPNMSEEWMERERSFRRAVCGMGGRVRCVPCAAWGDSREADLDPRNADLEAREPWVEGSAGNLTQGSSSWKANQNHPASQEIGDRKVGAGRL